MKNKQHYNNNKKEPIKWRLTALRPCQNLTVTPLQNGSVKDTFREPWRRSLGCTIFWFHFYQGQPPFLDNKDNDSIADFWKRRNLVFSVFKWLVSIRILSQDYFSKFKKSFFKTDPMVKTQGMKNSWHLELTCKTWRVLRSYKPEPASSKTIGINSSFMIHYEFLVCCVVVFF